MYPTLKSSDTSRLERKSSISQHSGMLSVLKKGEWCPLVADVIDSVKCGHIVSHKAGITDQPVLGYTFPVGNYKYITDVFLTGDEDKETLAVLPEWFGSGFYKTHIREKVFRNSGTESLGLHNEASLRVGLDYVVAKDLLKAADNDRMKLHSLKE